MNTYPTAARFYQRHALSSFYGEAHNDYLQLLAEGGLLVAIPALVCAAAFAREIRRRMKNDAPGSSWWLRRAAVAAIVAIGLQETVEFSLQLPGNAALFAVVCALAIHPPRDPRPEDRSGHQNGSTAAAPCRRVQRFRRISIVGPAPPRHEHAPSSCTSFTSSAPVPIS